MVSLVALDEGYEVTNSSPVGYLLPSRNKGGRRALMLVKCLAEAHNELVEKCREIQGDKTKYVLLFVSAMPARNPWNT